ncbi:MAG: response regulator [Candidatus Riflebacteria bacterium]|nr:response regulator [Candidatus Riflebacteria bacterium]
MTTGKTSDDLVRILLLEDSSQDAELIREKLNDSDIHHQLDWALNEPEFTAFLKNDVYDIVLADYQVPAFNGEQAFRLTKSLCPEVPFICVSAVIGEEKAVALLKLGATDYVSKFSLIRLPLSIQRALEEVKVHKARHKAEEESVLLEAQLQQAQKMEAIGRLAGGVAHDFNNMLSVILGHVEIALEQVNKAVPLYDSLEEIRKAAERSADLTRQLLTFARRQAIAPKLLNLNETLAGMLKMLTRLIGEDIQLIWRPEADLWTIRFDPSQVDQILANLCVNSRDAIAGAGKITIETVNCVIEDATSIDCAGLLPGEYVCLSVADDGCGFDQETQAHIFEPFFTTKGLCGTGLGLAMVFGAVKRNNGYISVCSESGHGTKFSIYLPRQKEEAGLPPEESSEKPWQGRGTILLVEDEPTVLRLTALLLENLGFRVLVANTPSEATRLAKEDPGEIDLLMTDVVMPEMNGRDLARSLQSLRPQMKCLFMSGYTADVIGDHGVLDTKVSFIQKPFSKKALADKIRGLLQLS